ncbi:hypothetical protein ATS72_014790 [Pseudoalteromonas sp. 13-15]|jgi:hypothetical protein|uniref:Orphan protein n=1 Tax=Pseudoalteromonas marina TaxID=267375 RepID=A0ABT9F8R0_9GAMM|nr:MULTISPECIES: hypothetical protein [Pseudoalteromonas]EAW28818.1 putative orphan protein [Alteromonadales bacterium TW-7]MBL1385015.1 hypothetical protein [Colwellia sp.]ATG59038.1 hypothetical protein CPA52_12715 [Pseudoalteromonas marina]AUL74771.1 hypothetical protein ATS72_014790 [Pseudoalteromonas sp. 13-15]KAF7779551.1 hypothetical protein PMAN_a0452 [Pseudoalteromonas marina]|tara:strand:- start:182 stop:418 length:237 start_codon:yes stop_codon:yes gene_type:complete
MHILIKTSVVALTLAVLAGCQNHVENAEMNQCAQQNFRCESTCEQQTTAEGLKQQVCSAKCVETYNQCKARAEKLGGI